MSTNDKGLPNKPYNYPENELWFDIDDGIEDVVLLLVENNFATFTSCEGGPRHAFDSPTVRMYPDKGKNPYETMMRLADVLTSNRYGGFYINLIHTFQNKPEFSSVFIELEFWADVVIPND